MRIVVMVGTACVGLGLTMLAIQSAPDDKPERQFNRIEFTAPIVIGNEPPLEGDFPVITPPSGDFDAVLVGGPLM